MATATNSWRRLWLNTQRVGELSPSIWRALGLLIGYVVLQQLTFLLRVPPTNITPLWLPGGLAMAVLLLRPVGEWWVYSLVVWIGWVGCMTVDHMPLGAAIGTGLCVALALVTGAWVIHRLCDERAMGDWRFVMVALTAATPLMVVLAAPLPLLYYVAGWRETVIPLVILLAPTMALILLAVLPTSLWVLSGGRVPAATRRPHWAEVGIVLLITGAAGLASAQWTGASTGYMHLLFYLPLPALLWSALRLGPAPTAVVSLVLCLVTLPALKSIDGPFAVLEPSARVTATQLALLAMIVPTVLVAGVMERERRTTREARDREARLHLTSEAAALGAWDYDAASGRVHWALGMASIFGIAEGEFTNTLDDVIHRIHPDDRKGFAGDIESCLQSGNRYDREIRLVRPTGEVRCVLAIGRAITDGKGRATRMIGIALDLTERRRAEEFTRQILESSPGLVYIYSVPEQRFTYVTPRSSEALGGPVSTNGDGRGRGPELELHPDDARDKLPKVLAELETGTEGAVVETQYRVRSVGGEWRQVVARGMAFRRDREGRLEQVIGTAYDITQHLQTQASLREALEDVQRLKDQLQVDNRVLINELVEANPSGHIVCASDAMRQVLAQVHRVAPTDTAVMLQGETGVGKEVIAREIHRLSRRACRPLVRVNCAALPANLIESELFGHERGAFTGAESRRIGRFEMADGGTLFLDEIGELPIELQAKLLRVLQEGEFERLGSAETRQVDVRIIAATNRSLSEEVRKNLFRADLFFRLNVYPIHIPPLRARRDDIPPLAAAILAQSGKRVGREFSGFAPAALAALVEHEWPGNVRELHNVIARAAVSAPGRVIRLTDLQLVDANGDAGSALTDPSAVISQLAAHDLKLEEFERCFIQAVIDRAGGQVAGAGGAAERLGLRPSTLRSRIAKLGLARKVRS